MCSYFGVLLFVALERLEQRGALWRHYLSNEGLALEEVLADLVLDDNHSLWGAPPLLLEAPDRKKEICWIRIPIQYTDFLISLKLAMCTSTISKYALTFGPFSRPFIGQ